MGACASRPKDLDKELAPAAAPTEESVTPKKVDKETPVPQEEKKEEKKDGEETKKEEPLVDVSKPAPEAPKIEEVTAAAATEPAKEEEKKAEEPKVEAVKEKPAEEKEEAEPVAK